MEKIIHKDGNVYLEITHDVMGRHKTIRFLGKEYKEETNEVKPKRKKKKDEA